jgi:hypothetical protein
MKYFNCITDLNHKVMKANMGLRHFLKVISLCAVLIAGTAPVQAQHGEKGHGGGGKGNKHSEYQYDQRRGNERYGHYEGQTYYYRRAPWGMHRPVRFYHNRTPIYYYGGHYYEYYPERGYCMIEIPAGYYFDEVPYGFNRVWIDGRWCYRRGDIYLRPSVHGFITFPGPAGITFGAGF